MRYYQHILSTVAILTLFLNNVTAQYVQSLPQSEHKFFHSYGVKANGAPIPYIQPNGTVIDIRQYGNIGLHCQTCSDGYPIVKDSDGYYRYAICNSSGDIVPSSIKVGDISSDGFNSIDSNKHTIIEQILETKELFQNSNNEFAARISQDDDALAIGNDATTQYVSPAFPSTGSRKLLIILANFSDTSPEYTQTDFQNLMSEPDYNETGSVRDYYYESSYGNLDLEITVIDWVTLPNNYEYYGRNNFDCTLHAIEQADPYIDFSDFDNDNDGIVDGIAVIHQGYGQEGSSLESDIWSHSSSLRALGYQTKELTFDNTIVDTYTIQPERQHYPKGISNIGTFCHEFGHILGAPDFYDTNFEIDGTQQGTGNWDLLSTGNYNGDQAGTVPAQPGMFTKFYYYNWYTPIELTESATITLPNSVDEPIAYYYTTPTSEEYYLIVNRQQKGFDRNIPGHGMLLYHVDKAWIDSHKQYNNINNTEHQGLYIKDAGGDGDINDSNCAFNNESISTIDKDSYPNTRMWSGEDSFMSITNIEELESGDIKFNFINGLKQTISCCNVYRGSDDEETINNTMFASVALSGLEYSLNEVPNIECWIGVSKIDSDPRTWTEECWIKAEFVVSSENITNGSYTFSIDMTDREDIYNNDTVFCASRFIYKGEDMIYGGDSDICSGSSDSNTELNSSKSSSDISINFWNEVDSGSVKTVVKYIADESGEYIDPFSNESITIESYSPTCSNLDNGSIMIESKLYSYTIRIDELNYDTHLDKGEYIHIEDLKSGSYSLNISSEGVDQEFTINLAAVEPIYVSNLTSNSSVTLMIEGGVKPYQVIVDNVMYQTNSNTLDISNLDNGTHGITVTDSNSCTNDESSTIHIETFALYPNPAVGGVVNIVVPQSLLYQQYSIGIYNMNNVKVHQESMLIDSSEVTLDIANIESGLYVLKLTPQDTQREETIKFIVQ